MHTQEQLVQEIDGLIDRIRSQSTAWPALTLLPSSSADKVNHLTARCLDLKCRVLGLDPKLESFFQVLQEFLALEILVRRRLAWNDLMPTVAAFYLGAGMLVLVLHLIDFSHIVTHILGVTAPEKLITLGMAGAFTYLATSLLLRVQKQEGNDQIRQVLDFSIRLTLAVLVPIILVVLFFKVDGTLGEATLSPELISFVCGYSSRLVFVAAGPTGQEPVWREGRRGLAG